MQDRFQFVKIYNKRNKSKLSRFRSTGAGINVFAGNLIHRELEYNLLNSSIHLVISIFVSYRNGNKIVSTRIGDKVSVSGDYSF